MTTKELKELLKLLRAQGVLKYESSDLKLELSEMVPESRSSQESSSAPQEKTWDEMTDEEKMYYSSGGPVPTVPQEQ